MIVGGQPADEMLLQFEAGVVGSEIDAHGQILTGRARR
jgi:hypothetical protein